VDNKRKKLTARFFNRRVTTVARDLLGKYLVRKIGDKEMAFKITEVESYDGEKDLACHASKGRTMRTEVMYGEAGTIYVYLIYGMYYMLNIVTGPKDYPAAVLVRGLEGINGPGRLTKTLAINRKLNGLPLAFTAGLWIEDRGEVVSKKDIEKTARIGVEYAGPIWSQKLYRFMLKDSRPNKKTAKIK